MRRRWLALLLALAPARAPAWPVEARLAAGGFAGIVLYGDAAGPPRVAATGRFTTGQRWRWASVTKQLTALLVMQEVAAGRLALDRPVKAYWPGWPSIYADAITIRMLLQHRSGLADPAATPPGSDGVPAFYRRQGRAAAPPRTATGFCAERPRAVPGSGFHYNNCDYIVLGALLEHVTGKPFARLVDERIRRPLGLASLGLFAPDRPAVAHVTGTVRGRREPRLNLGSYGGAGSAYGSPRDLWTFEAALLGHRLLDPVMTAAMWAGDPALGDQALGAWSYGAPLKGCAGDTALVERQGEIEGVQLRVFLAPARNRILLAFANRSGKDMDFGQVRQGRGLAYDLLSAAFCGQGAAP